MNITKAKYSIFAGLRNEKPSSDAVAQITTWFEGRNYSFVDDLKPVEYAQELEQRLLILQNFTFNAFFVAPLTGRENTVWRHSCNTNNAKLADLKSCITNNQSKLAPAAITFEKAENLQARYQLAKEFAESLPTLPENSSSSQIEEHSKKMAVALNRQTYLSPISKQDRSVLASIDLENYTDQEILKELAVKLPEIRKQLAITELTKSNRNTISLSPFINHYALQYLDLLIYCLKPEQCKASKKVNNELLRPPAGSFWYLTDPQIAEIIDRFELDAEKIKLWRKEIYKPKLLNDQYIKAIILNVRASSNQ